MVWYHRRSIRLQGYDYSQCGAYFVTLCTQQRDLLFGQIVDGTLQTTAYGDVANNTWEWIGQHFSSVELDTWCLMPNHLHGVLVVYDANDTQMQHKPLGRLIGAYKTVSTKQINAIRATPGEVVWQRNYYERIIRGETELTKIRRYIADNPEKWVLGLDDLWRYDL